MKIICCKNKNQPAKKNVTSQIIIYLVRKKLTSWKKTIQLEKKLTS